MFPDKFGKFFMFIHGIVVLVNIRLNYIRKFYNETNNIRIEGIHSGDKQIF